MVTKREKNVLRYQGWVRRCERKNAPLAAYACPGCEQELKALVPPPGDIYDTMTTCPFCDFLALRIVKPSGKVTMVLPPETLQ